MIAFAVGFGLHAANSSASPQANLVMSPIATRPYHTVLQIISVVWLIVAVLALAAHSFSPPAVANGWQAETPSLTSGDALVIAGLSGLIAIASTLPGCFIIVPEQTAPASSMVSRPAEADETNLPPPQSASESSRNVELSPHDLALERLGQAFLAGMLIRLTGTVALFLGCSYYMEASPTQIGIWVLGWHLVLLLTEVITLSRQIRVS